MDAPTQHHYSTRTGEEEATPAPRGVAAMQHVPVGVAEWAALCYNHSSLALAWYAMKRIVAEIVRRPV